MAISAYRTVHTGPKTQLGGLSIGLVSVAYQDVISLVVKTDPRAAAAYASSREAASTSAEFLVLVFIT